MIESAGLESIVAALIYSCRSVPVSHANKGMECVRLTVKPVQTKACSRSIRSPKFTCELTWRDVF